MISEKATSDTSPLPDASLQWLDQCTPSPVKPYVKLARLDRPIGWQLLFLPCLWSSALASLSAAQPLNLLHILLFVIGAIAMRGAGSTYNDLLDRKIDARVERTKHRPLASGQVTLKQAVLFIAVQAAIGLAVLVQFNHFAILVGLCSLIPVLLYPFMKRFMPVPQLVLGFAFGWGALMGWAAFYGSLSATPLLLYAATLFWIIGYDTIYALQDLEDDEVAGIHSSARFFDTHLKPALTLLYGASILLVLSAFYLTGVGLFSYAGLGLFAGHLAAQVKHVNPHNKGLALYLFRSNRNAGLLLAGGLLADNLVKWVV